MILCDFFLVSWNSPVIEIFASALQLYHSHRKLTINYKKNRKMSENYEKMKNLVLKSVQSVV